MNSVRSLTFSFFLPLSWNLLIFTTLKKVKNSKVCYFYSPVYYIKFTPSYQLQQITFFYQIKTLRFRFFYFYNSLIFFFKFLSTLFTLFSRPLFLKLKFKGKGYYIYKNKRNTITPQFGYAHRLYLYSYFVSVKFLSKTSIIVFGFDWNDLITIGLNIKKMRSINIFTGRGVRFTRQIIYKKTGKVSTYR